MHRLSQNNHCFSKITYKSHSIKSTDFGFSFMFLFSVIATTARGRNQSIRQVEYTIWCETPNGLVFSISHIWCLSLLQMFSRRAQKVIINCNILKEIFFLKEMLEILWWKSLKCLENKNYLYFSVSLLFYPNLHSVTGGAILRCSLF